jgi:hypothetical protein
MQECKALGVFSQLQSLRYHCKSLSAAYRCCCCCRCCFVQIQECKALGVFSQLQVWGFKLHCMSLTAAHQCCSSSCCCCCCCCQCCQFYIQECKALGVFSQLQALEYLGGKLTQRGNRAFERRRKSKVGRGCDLTGRGGANVVAHVLLCCWMCPLLSGSICDTCCCVYLPAG